MKMNEYGTVPNQNTSPLSFIGSIGCGKTILDVVGFIGDQGNKLTNFIFNWKNKYNEKTDNV